MRITVGQVAMWMAALLSDSPNRKELYLVEVLGQMLRTMGTSLHGHRILELSAMLEEDVRKKKKKGCTRVFQWTTYDKRLLRGLKIALT